MRFLTRFGRFWYDFIVGDDWSIAVGVVVALALTGVAAHHGVTAWWLVPLAVAALLFGSLRRAARAGAGSAATRPTGQPGND